MRTVAAPSCLYTTLEFFGSLVSGTERRELGIKVKKCHHCPPSTHAYISAKQHDEFLVSFTTMYGVVQKKSLQITRKGSVTFRE